MRNYNNEATTIKILNDALSYKEQIIDNNLELISFYTKQILKHTEENEQLFSEMNKISDDIYKIKPS